MVVDQKDSELNCLDCTVFVRGTTFILFWFGEELFPLRRASAVNLFLLKLWQSGPFGVCGAELGKKEFQFLFPLFFRSVEDVISESEFFFLYLMITL